MYSDAQCVPTSRRSCAPCGSVHAFSGEPVDGAITGEAYKYNASVIDFSDVVCDRLSAGTVNDGLMLISKLIRTVVPTEHEDSCRC